MSHGDLAPELQATALAEAIEVDHPAEAAQIRAWHPTARRAMVTALDHALRERQTAKVAELWRMRRGKREVRCVAVLTSAGVDLRLLEGQEMVRTQLFREAAMLTARAEQWRDALRSVGWTCNE